MKLLKVFFVFLLVFAVSSGVSAESKESLSDLLYAPAAGKLFIDVSYMYMKADADIKSSGTKLATIGITRSASVLTIGYGLTNSLALAVSGEYLIKEEKEMKFEPAFNSGATVKDESSGFGDPNFILAYRFFDSSGPVIGDISFAYSPKMGEQEGASSDPKKDGNNFRGGHGFEFGLDFAKKFREFSLALELGYGFSTTKDVKELEDDEKKEISGGEVFSAELFFQQQITPQFFIVAGPYFEYTFEEEEKKVSDGSKDKTDPYSGYGIHAGLKIMPIAEQLLIEVYYRYGLNGTQKVTESDGSKMEIDKLTSHIIIVGATLQI